MHIKLKRKGLEKFFIYGTFASGTLRDKRTVPKPKRILSRLNDGWQGLLPKKMRRTRSKSIRIPVQIIVYKSIARIARLDVSAFHPHQTPGDGNPPPVNCL